MKFFTLVSAVLVVLSMNVVPSGASEKWVVYEGKDGPGKGKHIVLISGDEEYRSEESLPMLGKLLSVRHGFKCTVLFSQNPKTGEIDPDNQTNIPGMELIDTADLLIVHLRFRELPDEDMKHFVDYVNSGKPMIGLRTSTHAFNYRRNRESKYAKYSFNNRKWKGGFGQQVLGDTWINHHGHHKVESTRGVIRPKYKDHPILRGVKDVWGPTDVYGVRNLTQDAHVLLDGQVLKGMSPKDEPNPDKKTMPLFWTKKFKGEAGNATQIVCTTMGSSTDYANEGLRRATVNSVYWLLGMESKITDDLNVAVVGDYKPTPYGFKTFTRGVKPSDHKLKP